jgi:hypothetical protein
MRRGSETVSDPLRLCIAFFLKFSASTISLSIPGSYSASSDQNQ